MTNTTMKNYIKKRLEEFEKEFAHVRQTDRHYANPWIPEMKSFVIESIHQAVAEERERILDGLPEKKYFGKDYIEGSNSDSNYVHGYNQALDDLFFILDKPLTEKESE